VSFDGRRCGVPQLTSRVYELPSRTSGAIERDKAEIETASVQLPNESWLLSEADSRVLVFGGQAHVCAAKTAPFNLTCCDLLVSGWCPSAVPSDSPTMFWDACPPCFLHNTPYSRIWSKGVLVFVFGAASQSLDWRADLISPATKTNT
jgi:hypothetical protein